MAAIADRTCAVSATAGGFLRFCLMCSPTALFLLPGILLTVLGLLAIPVAMLTGHGRYDTFFGPNFMFGTSVIALSGWHLMLFGFLAKLHAHHVNPVFRDPKIEKLGGGVHGQSRLGGGAGHARRFRVSRRPGAGRVVPVVDGRRIPASGSSPARSSSSASRRSSHRS